MRVQILDAAQHDLVEGYRFYEDQVDEKEVRRLLDPRHASKMSRLEFALAALGQQLVVGVQAAV